MYIIFINIYANNYIKNFKQVHIYNFKIFNIKLDKNGKQVEIYLHFFFLYFSYFFLFLIKYMCFINLYWSEKVILFKWTLNKKLVYKINLITYIFYILVLFDIDIFYLKQKITRFYVYFYVFKFFLELTINIQRK